MAEKKHYLIRVWGTSELKESDKSKESYVVKEENNHDGFNLLQERIIKCYESNIQNLYVSKGLRSTYEEVKAPKEDTKKAQPS